MSKRKCDVSAYMRKQNTSKTGISILGTYSTFSLILQTAEELRGRVGATGAASDQMATEHRLRTLSDLLQGMFIITCCKLYKSF